MAELDPQQTLLAAAFLGLVTGWAFGLMCGFIGAIAVIRRVLQEERARAREERRC